MLHLLGIALILAPQEADEYCLRRLDQLLAWHDYYGLPIPPRDAALVKVTSPRTTWQGGEYVVEFAEPTLLFALGGGTFWPNYQQKTMSVRCVKPTAALAGGNISADWLEVALAAHDRKWKSLALAAYRKWAAKDEGWHTEEKFAWEALDRWKLLVHDPDVPLSTIVKYLRRAIPAAGWKQPSDHKLLRSLELTLTPRQSPPGSDDALIDALVGLSGYSGDDHRGGGFREDPRYRAIVRRGLAAVPALIAHLKDERITRARRLTCGDQHLRVREVVYDILTQFHGKGFDVVEFDDLNEQLKVIGNWFADAHKMGEEMYFTSRLLAEDVYYHESLIWFLAERYPRRLPDVFRKYIDSSDRAHDVPIFAKAVAEAPIPEADKRKTLAYAADHIDPVTRTAVVRPLRLVDPKLAKAKLLQGLEEMPPRVREPQAELARTVAEGTDPDEWRALALMVRSADAENRIRFLEEIAGVTAPAGRKHRLAFLAEYLADDEEYRNPQTFATPGRIRVRDAAATQLAELLGLDDAYITSGRVTDLQAALRAAVRKRLKEELGR